MLILRQRRRKDFLIGGAQSETTHSEQFIQQFMKHGGGGAHAPGAPPVPTPMYLQYYPMQDSLRYAFAYVPLSVRYIQPADTA